MSYPAFSYPHTLQRVRAPELGAKGPERARIGRNLSAVRARYASTGVPVAL